MPVDFCALELLHRECCHKRLWLGSQHLLPCPSSHLGCRMASQGPQAGPPCLRPAVLTFRGGVVGRTWP